MPRCPGRSRPLHPVDDAEAYADAVRTADLAFDATVLDDPDDDPEDHPLASEAVAALDRL
ncbi:hypothetical protein ACFYUY_21690 [Kitasatospora sp. NPDC004745]|uniref:hypothetical protein n=1 Tax=Kitasatospora sp. NPDC004745 TaxID=3364019 RepID=UPI0036C817E1